MIWPFNLFKKRVPKAISVEAELPPTESAVIASGYESTYPMLPRDAIFAATDGGFEFHGSLGPENVLDLRFFQALARSWSKNRHGELAPTEEEIEAKAVEIAHTVFGFYLTFFTYSRDIAQEKAKEFWTALLQSLA